MRVFVVNRPGPVVSLADAKKHLKVEHDDENALIEGMVAAATGHIDGPNGWLGRAIGEQVLEMRVDNFGCGSIPLPYPPFVEILQVRYVDDGGVERTADPLYYEVLGRSLMSRFGATWPYIRGQREAVRIRYRAGYSPEPGAVTAEGEDRTLPDPIRQAILLMVSDMHRNRGGTTNGFAVTAVPMSTTVENLLHPFRVFA